MVIVIVILSPMFSFAEVILMNFIAGFSVFHVYKYHSVEFGSKYFIYLFFSLAKLILPIWFYAFNLVLLIYFYQ